MMLDAIRDADELLIQDMLAPLPLEQTRSSLEFWRQRRMMLPFYRRTERREADEMIRRWQVRLLAAERARFGTGFIGLVRRLLAFEPLEWHFQRTRPLIAFVWSILPRQVALILVAVLGAFVATALAIGLGLTILVLSAT
jgi:hypothetical protein